MKDKLGHTLNKNSVWEIPYYIYFCCGYFIFIISLEKLIIQVKTSTHVNLYFWRVGPEQTPEGKQTIYRLWNLHRIFLFS